MGSVVISLSFLIFGILVIGCLPYQRMMYNVLELFVIVTLSSSIFIFYLARISDIITVIGILFLLSLPIVYYVSIIIIYFGFRQRSYTYRLKEDAMCCRKRSSVGLDENFGIKYVRTTMM